MLTPAELAEINAKNRATYEATQAAKEAEQAEKKLRRHAALKARHERMLETSCGHVEETGNPRKGCDCQTCVRRRKVKNTRQRAHRKGADPDKYWDSPIDGPNYRADRFAQYGITEEDYYRILADQDHKCAICGTNKPGGRNGRNSWHIDHDHKTGKVRGLLCRNCNWGLGQFKDSIERLEAAITYLAKTEDK